MNAAQSDSPGVSCGNVVRKLVLVVDDNIVFRKAIAMKLRSFGFDVMAAEDGSEALAAVSRARPDLILLDLNFPPDVAHGGGLAWDGFLILNWLRRTHGAIGVPVIVVTGEDVEQHAAQCKKLGIADVLPKPVDHEVLIRKIRAILDQEPEPPPQARPPVTLTKRVLFIDDDSGWRGMAIRNLKDQGCDVVVADTAETALSEGARIRPDVIVLDLKLEKASGVRVMKVMSTAHPEVPLLVYAGMGLPKEAKEELLKQGAFQVLQKRSMEELVGAMEMGMARRLQDLTSRGQAPEHKPPTVAELGFESVLIVEDNPEFTEMLRAYLEAHSLSVTSVPNVTEGLRQIAAIDFDMVLCDMVLPGQTGEDFYRQVEVVKPELCRKFIFMTGHDADPRTDGFIRRVRAFMLWKPFALTDLLAAAQTIRRRERLASLLAHRQTLLVR